MHAERIALASQLLLALALCALAGCATQDQKPAPTPRDTALSAMASFMRNPSAMDALWSKHLSASAKSQMEESRFSGALILGRSGRILHERAVGLAQREKGIPFTLDTAADGASLAKTFTAAAVHLLVDEGKLELDAPVRRYLPTYPDASTTLRHLITHCNGLPDYDFFDKHFAKDSVRNTADLLAVLVKEKFTPPFPPGSKFEYGNLGFDFAALIVEQVTGEPFPKFLDTRFFRPLGMTATFARPGRFADWPGERTLAYHAPPRENELNDVFDGEAFIGGSNLYFTARDLHRWVSAFATGEKLPPAVLKAADQPVLINGKPSGIRAGNWYCAEGPDPATRCYYTGSLNGFYSFAYWDRRTGDTAVYLTNNSFQSAETANFDRKLITSLALARFPFGTVPTQPTTILKPAFIEIDANIRKHLPGTYLTSQPSGAITLHISQSADGKRLLMRMGEGLSYTMFKIAPDQFYVPGIDAAVGFSLVEKAPVLHLRSLFTMLDAPRTQPISQ